MHKYLSIFFIVVLSVVFPRIGYTMPSFLEAFEKHNSVMLLIDPATGVIVDANTAASRFYGYSRHDLKSSKIQTINLLTPQQVKDEIKLAKTEGRNFFIFRHQLANGEIKTVEVYSVPLKFDGKVLLYSIIQDISEKRDTAQDRWHYEKRLEEMVDLQTEDIQAKTRLTVLVLSFGLFLLLVIIICLTYVLKRRHEAEVALVESEQKHKKSALRLDEIIWGTNIGTWELDIETGLIVINDRWAETLGYQLSEVSPLTFDRWMYFMHPKDAKKSRELIDRHFNNELDFYQVDARMQHKDDCWVWVLFRGKVVEWSEDGKPLRMSGTQKQINDRKQYEAELHDARLKAEMANEAKSQFLATMSHEIRTPMTGVIGFSDLLLEDNLPSESQDKVLRIKDSTNSLLMIINDVLDMSKMEAGKMTLEKMDFHLHSLVAAVVEHFANRLNSNPKLKLKTTINENVPDRVNADPLRLRQVLVNLIGNAVKFTDEGQIEIIVRMQKIGKGLDKVHFSVRDDGIGIAEQTLPTIFSEFTQADTSTTRIYEGTGLGLAICKKLVELSGGNIGVKSTLGDGSTFWFTLPHIPASREIIEESTEKPKSDFKTVKSLKILVAEDNPINQMIVKSILTKYGHEVVIVEDGEKAVTAVKANTYDLIFMDIRMPEMNGIEATRIIRQLGGAKSTIPIIALTADAMKEHQKTYFEVGMGDCVTKPYGKSDLLLAINKALAEEIHVPVRSKIDRTAGLSTEMKQFDRMKPSKVTQFDKMVPIGDDAKAREFKKHVGEMEAQEIFLEATENLYLQIEELRTVVDDENALKISEVAHNITGVSSSLYGTQLSNIARHIHKNADDIFFVEKMMPKIEKVAVETMIWWKEMAKDKGQLN